MCFAIIGNAMAQTGTPNSKRINENDVPVVVLEALEKQFLDVTEEKWRLIPFDVFDKEYVMNYQEEGNVHNGLINYYEVSINIGGDKIAVVYNKNGHLIHSREVVKNEEIPQEVMASVARNFPGWKIVFDSSVLKDESSNLLCYRVEIEKEKKHKMLMIGKHGTIMKAFQKEL